MPRDPATEWDDYIAEVQAGRAPAERVPTTAELSGAPAGPPLPDAGLRRIYADARMAGLDDEGARVAAAIARTEGGMGGALGDNGESAGAFQFYSGGQLANYAAATGQTIAAAKAQLQQDPHAGNYWALRPGGYLGDAIRRGQKEGMHGPTLATFAQDTGQVSVTPARAGQNYVALYSGAAPTADPQPTVRAGAGVDTSGRDDWRAETPAAPQQAPTSAQQASVVVPAAEEIGRSRQSTGLSVRAGEPVDSSDLDAWLAQHMTMPDARRTGGPFDPLGTFGRFGLVR